MTHKEKLIHKLRIIQVENTKVGMLQILKKILLSFIGQLSIKIIKWKSLILSQKSSSLISIREMKWVKSLTLQLIWKEAILINSFNFIWSRFKTNKLFQKIRKLRELKYFKEPINYYPSLCFSHIKDMKETRNIYYWLIIMYRLLKVSASEIFSMSEKSLNLKNSILS
jgi:hypothetical protein